MKKLIAICIAVLSIVSYGQWGMMQPQMIPQQIDIMLAQASPDRRQAAIVGYWQDVIKAANSGNVMQQQLVVSLAPIIQKYDAQFQQHLQAAMQVAAFMTVCGGGGGMIPNPPMPVTPIGGGYGGGSSGGGSGVCPVCHGSGSCKICHGTGTYRNYGQSVPCNPKCSSCGGTGQR